MAHQSLAGSMAQALAYGERRVSFTSIARLEYSVLNNIDFGCVTGHLAQLLNIC